MAFGLEALPIIALILVGVGLRAGGLVDRRSGLALARVVYHTTIPAAIFTSIARSRLTAEMGLLTALGFGLPCLLAGVMFLTTRRLKDRPASRGVLLAGMVVLGVFGYPFISLFYGPEGLARMAMYDVGNSLYAGSVALVLARTFGARCADEGACGVPWGKVVTSPILLAAVLGVGVSLLGWEPPAFVGSFLDLLARANTPLAMMAVGVFVRPRRGQLGLVLQYVSIRMALGGLLAWSIALLAGLNGLDLVVAVTASSLPAGTTALVYASNEGLDAELAAAIISTTVILGALLINLVPLLLGGLYL